jgi:hypothetical protein
MFRVALFITMLLALPSVGHPCTCSGPDSFHAATKRAQIVVHGRVTEHRDFVLDGTFPRSMAFEVVTPIRNGTKGETLIVLGDQGIFCFAPAVSRFPVGTEWVFALMADSDKAPQQKVEGPRKLAFVPCGVSWLQVKGSTAIGPFKTTSEDTETPLREIMTAYGPNRPVERDARKNSARPSP